MIIFTTGLKGDNRKYLLMVTPGLGFWHKEQPSPEIRQNQKDVLGWEWITMDEHRRRIRHDPQD